MAKASTRKNKYRARKVEFDGITFDSMKEGHRYLDLKDLQRAGDIENLECHPRYDLIVAGMKCGFYKADFRYRCCRTGDTIVEDVKGVKTAVYRLKKKLVKAIHNVDIVEV